MKKLNYIPYVALVAYLTLLFFRSPSVADSLIIISLCSLLGFYKFLGDKESPDYLKLFNKELSLIKTDVQNVKDTTGQLGLANQRKSERDSFRF